MNMQSSPASAVERKQETSSLADVVTIILEKGVVVDVFARVSLVGIELLRVDARVVIAGVDTYLRFAEAANRVQMGTEEPKDLTGVVEGITESGAKGKTKGAIEGGVDKLRELVSSGDREGEPARRTERHGSRRSGREERRR